MTGYGLVLVRQDSLGNIQYDSWYDAPNAGVDIPNIIEYKEFRYRASEYPGGFKILLVENYSWEEDDYSWLDDTRIVVWESGKALLKEAEKPGLEPSSKSRLRQVPTDKQTNDGKDNGFDHNDSP